jgi:membrane associated rhomboid family serine protease
MNRPSASELPAGPSALGVLMLICAAVHGLRWFAIPAEPHAILPGAFSLEALQRGEWWTCLTHIFMHAGLWHLGINLLLFWLAGRSVQAATGQQNTVNIFLLSAWAGAAASFLTRPEASIIGASGGIMGLAGACSSLFPEQNLLRFLRPRLNFTLRAKQLFPALLIAFLIQEALAHTGLYGASSSDAHMVHAGGILAGWLYGRRLATARDTPRNTPAPLPFRRRGPLDATDHSLLLASLTTLPPSRRSIKEQQPAAVALPALSDAEFLSQQVDPVLEKLYASGAGLLTAGEKAILEEAARRFPKKTESSSPPDRCM